MIAHDKRREQGATLAITLSMLLLVAMLGIAAAQISLQGEKLARNERDRQLALLAAEAALLDAEMDIAHASAGSRPLSRFFSADSRQGFPDVSADPCARGAHNIYLGMCRSIADGAKPTWQSINFLDDSTGAMHTVPYGYFTGRTYPVDAAALPARLPRYAIEVMEDLSMRAVTGKPCYFYRLTAIGFGALATTQVVLQSVYRKALPPDAAAIAAGSTDASAARHPAGRLSWREIVNWPELNVSNKHGEDPS